MSLEDLVLWDSLMNASTIIEAGACIVDGANDVLH